MELKCQNMGQKSDYPVSSGQDGRVCSWPTIAKSLKEFISRRTFWKTTTAGVDPLVAYLTKASVSPSMWFLCTCRCLSTTSPTNWLLLWRWMLTQAPSTPMSGLSCRSRTNNKHWRKIYLTITNKQIIIIWLIDVGYQWEDSRLRWAATNYENVTKVAIL